MKKVFLLRRDGMGDNCHHVSNNYPGKNMIVGTAQEMPDDIDWVLRWGTRSKLPYKPKGGVINFSDAIAETYDKGTFRKRISDLGYAPRTWLTYDEYVNDPYEDFDYAIVRPRHHQRGADLHFCTTLDEVAEACAKCAEIGPYYISEFIDKVSEYRVFIVQGRIICVLQKFMPKRRVNEVAWGLAARYEYVNWSQWPLSVCEVAVKSFNASNLHFAAMDIVVDAEGKAFFLEANTAPEVWPYYGSKLAECIHHMVETNNTKRIIIKDDTNWKGYIHPVVSVKSIV